MNKNQKIILAIFVPVISFFVTLYIAHETSPSNPFNWWKTWFVWVLFLIIVCFFEYKLFEDKKTKKKN